MARILVVDRAYSVRDALAFVLELDGHSVVQASGGHDALDRLTSTPHPEVALVDATLDDMSFTTFCGAMRRLAPSVRVVVMSLSEADGAATAPCAPAAFLAKPFAESDLLAALAPAA